MTAGRDETMPAGRPRIERRRRSRRPGFSLQINILSAFATLLLVIIVTLVAFAYNKNSASVLELTGRFISRVGEASVTNTMSMFNPVAANVQATARLAAIDPARGRDGSLFPYFKSVLDTSPQLQSIYLAFQADGRFLQAFAIPAGAERFGVKDAKPPEGARYAFRTVERHGGTVSDSWIFVAGDGVTQVGSERTDELNYDPRKRDWYQATIAGKGLYWSDLVVYTSSRQPGIAAAYPIIAADGTVIGAAAANVTLRQLSDFMGRLDLGQSGVALISDEAGQLIAYPDASRTVQVDGLKAQLVKAEVIGDVRVSEAFAAHRVKPERMVRFKAEGHNYLAFFMDFPGSFGKKWLMTVIVLENDFVGTLKENNRDIVAVSVALAALGLVGVFILAGWITRPIRILGEEIRKIQRFDLAGPIDLHAMVAEVNGLIHSLNMMKRALRTFGMFVPRDLVRELVASGRPIELGGQDRVLTVMFTDIADFTGLSERMAAGDLLVHVSRHLAAISQCVAEQEGTVDKYIGDAVMAFWGAPTPRDDHALRACTAALSAKRMQGLLNREWSHAGLPTLFVRIGLHTANVIVGNIGSDWRMSYTAVGDGVNVASRLEGVNKVYGSQICISEAVVQAAGETVVVRPLDVVAVKGRKTGEKVYELLALSHGPAELLATPAQLEWCRRTEAAFAAYQAQRWEEAMALYQDVAVLEPDDGLPAIFIQRCRHYLAEPPEAWNGIYEMKVK